MDFANSELLWSYRGCGNPEQKEPRQVGWLVGGFLFLPSSECGQERLNALMTMVMGGTVLGVVTEEGVYAVPVVVKMVPDEL